MRDPKAVLLALISSVAVLGATQACAETPPCPSSSYFTLSEGELVGEMATLPQPSQRRDFARSLLARLQPLYSAIPELSPDETKWLDGEIAARGTRMMRAWESTIGHKRNAKEHTRDMIRDLTVIRDGKLDERREIGVWAILAQNYGNETFGRSVGTLADNTIISDSFAPRFLSMPRDVLIDGACRHTASEIMRKIVIPWLFSANKEP